MQPLIAITGGEINHNGETWAPVAHGQFHTYTDAIVRAGGAPFILPLVSDEAVLKRLYEQCSGLLLSGGNDLDPKSYSAPSSTKTTGASPKRDSQEVRLLQWALRDDKPVLGICRGMQILNVTLGGSLHQDISVDLPAAHNHTLGIDQKNFQQLDHRLTIATNSNLAEILGTEHIDTNTLHHQAIQTLGDGLIASAHAEDGIIEAIELPGKRFVIGLQSHPEALEAETEPGWRLLFQAFVKATQGS